MKFKKKIKFSIIVVSLNTKKLFLKTINSILKQNCKNFEIIVIDGGSIDGTQKIIFKNKKYFSKYLIEKDKGIYHAMNKGIKRSSGRWIIFMNSGDIFYNKNVLKKLMSQDMDSFDIVFGDTVICTKELNYLVYSRSFDSNTYLMPFCHQSVFVNSVLLKKRNFSLKYKFSSDFNFFYNCYLCKKKFKKLDLIISKVKSAGLSDKNRQKVFNENLMIIGKKNNKDLKFMLYLIKFNQYFKDLFKMITPHFIKKIILKNKYKSFLVK
tara:strand:- start:16692 stop:17489 length:798 start_codon:yes stop_codon:yes gene_type:complete